MFVDRFSDLFLYSVDFQQMDGVRMEIQPFRIEDYDHLLSLWVRTGLPHDQETRDNRKALEGQLFDDHVLILVLKDQGQIVGSIVASHDGRKGWINRLAIDPDYRGRRLAARLLEAAEKFLVEAGIRIIADLIEDENTPSMAAFKRCGYDAWSGIVYFRKLLKN